MESWRKTWRKHVAPHLTRPCLEALQRGLANGDDRIVQGIYVLPQCHGPDAQQQPPAGACPIGFALWQGFGLDTANQVGAAVDILMRDSVGEWGFSDVRYFTRWVDREPWEIVRHALLAEVQRSLALRERGLQDITVMDLDVPQKV